MKLPKEIFPGLTGRAVWMSIERSKIPAVAQLSNHDPVIHNSYVPPRTIYCKQAPDGSYKVYSDLAPLIPELKLILSSHIDCFVLDATTDLSTIQYQTFLEHINFIEPARYGLSSREAYIALIQSQHLQAHVASYFGNQNSLTDSAILKYLPNTSKTSLKRYRKAKKKNNAMRSKIAREAYVKRKPKTEPAKAQPKPEKKPTRDSHPAITQQTWDF